MENQILEKVEKMRTLQKAINEIEGLEIPEEPKTKNVYSLSEYEQHKSETIHYNKVLQLKFSEKKALENSYKNTVEEIIQLLPASNTWFKIRNFHIGYETDDWPMSKPTFYLKEDTDETDLPKLKHRHIPG